MKNSNSAVRVSKTFAALQAEAATAPKYILVSTQYGFPLYIADPEKTKCPITDTPDEALQYSAGFDDPEMKLATWRTITGYDLQIKYL